MTIIPTRDGSGPGGSDYSDVTRGTKDAIAGPSPVCLAVSKYPAPKQQPNQNAVKVRRSVA